MRRPRPAWLLAPVVLVPLATLLLSRVAGRPTFARVQRDHLETAVARYDHPRRAATLALVGTVHVGRSAYHEALQRDLDAADLVLFEGISGLASHAPIGDVHRRLARTCGLVFPTDHLRGGGPRFVRADLSFEEWVAVAGEHAVRRSLERFDVAAIETPTLAQRSAMRAALVARGAARGGRRLRVAGRVRAPGLIAARTVSRLGERSHGASGMRARAPRGRAPRSAGTRRARSSLARGARRGVMNHALNRDANDTGRALESPRARALARTRLPQPEDAATREVLVTSALLVKIERDRESVRLAADRVRRLVWSGGGPSRDEALAALDGLVRLFHSRDGELSERLQAHLAWVTTAAQNRDRHFESALRHYDFWEQGPLAEALRRPDAPDPPPHERVERRPRTDRVKRPEPPVAPAPGVPPAAAKPATAPGSRTTTTRRAPIPPPPPPPQTPPPPPIRLLPPAQETAPATPGAPPRDESQELVPAVEVVAATPGLRDVPASALARWVALLLVTSAAVASGLATLASARI